MIPAMRPASTVRLTLAAAALALSGAASGAERGTVLPPPANRPVEFATDIQPIFASHCVSCHGPEKQKSGWRADRMAVALTGGDGSAPNIVPGNSADSPLIHYVAGTDPHLVMPEDGDRLTAEEIGLLRAWIDQGASWPESSSDSAIVEATTPWWSLQPLRRVDPSAEGANPIDAFIRAKLREAGLPAAPPADRRTLARRVYLDLIGLPPPPDELKAFIADGRPDAYERLVDRLLASPRHGERWARHWLDVVHYGDTHGFDKDQPRKHAWPYRDYVIRAFNADKPYARFILEQLAGDVLFPETRDGYDALGFLAAGPWDQIGHMELPETKIDGKIARHLDRDNLISTVAGTFLSTTVGCAQCHDHKFDPIPQEDYYSLQAVFAALDRADKKFIPGDPAMTARIARTEGARAEKASAVSRYEREVERAAGAEFEAIASRISALNRLGAEATPSDQQALAEARARRRELLDAATTPAQREAIAALRAAIAALDHEIATLPPSDVVYAGTVVHGGGHFRGTGSQGGRPRPIHVLARGQVTMPRAEVQPGALDMLAFAPSRFALAPDATEGARRVALAQWIAHPENPLTWRSIVNRVWQYHFGRGLVETAGDFGRHGALPSHPELLDWLAREFRDRGGSLKWLHRQIVLSETYRQSSADHPAGIALDPGNALLWRQRRMKRDAEAVRDAVLAVSGKLDLTMGGPGWRDFVVERPEHSPTYRYDRADPEDSETWRRAVYRFLVRSQTQPFMTSLDCADPSQRVDRRNESLSALQALSLLNNGFMVTQARYFAARIERETAAPTDRVALTFRRGRLIRLHPPLRVGTTDRVALAFRLALAREPSAAESAEAVAFATKNGWANFCRVLLNLNEFHFVD